MKGEVDIYLHWSMIYNLTWEKVYGWKILSRVTVKTPEKAAVECVWSLTTTVCSVPVLPGERVYAQSFAVPGVAGIVTVESISHSVCVEPTAVVP